MESRGAGPSMAFSWLGLGPPAECPFTVSFFGVLGSPTKIDYRRKRSWCPYSSLSTGGPSGGGEQVLEPDGEMTLSEKRPLKWKSSCVKIGDPPATKTNIRGGGGLRGVGPSRALNQIGPSAAVGRSKP